MIERQELYCHGCDRYVQFNVDMSLNGNHEFDCPVCGHTHYRVVENGRITDIRYRSSMQTYGVTNITTSSISTYDSSATTNLYFYDRWNNTADSTGGYFYA